MNDKNILDVIIVGLIGGALQQGGYDLESVLTESEAAHINALLGYIDAEYARGVSIRALRASVDSLLAVPMPTPEGGR